MRPTRFVTCVMDCCSFSPLLIGERRATTRRPPTASSSSRTFSPLLIGERRATRPGRRDGDGGEQLSVPSSSGNVVRPIREGRDQLARLAFSPLLIGERRATRADAMLGADDLPDFQSPPHRGTSCDTLRRTKFPTKPFFFQSPPHRGTSCDFQGWSGRMGTSRLSVPSSSGNVVRHQAPSLPPLPGRLPLSVPSSSGNVVRLVAVLCFALLFLLFQSPPHRGTSCDLCGDAGVFRSTDGAFSPLLIGERRATRVVPRVGGLRVVAFSPLLIGERRATDRGLRFSENLANSFQSPPHRGTSCDRARTRSWTSSRWLSVPSSSGNVVRLMAAAAPPLARFTLSVPSSSGNVVRLVKEVVPLNWLRAFSPLLIGERRATFSPTRQHSHQPPRFQSPPHRGTSCDAAAFRGIPRAWARS